MIRGVSGLNETSEAEPDPVVVPADAIDWPRVVTAHKAIPVWVRLTFDDGRAERTERGFAKAWTARHVRVQVLWRLSYYRGAREFWVEPSQVRRRVIEPQWLGRSA
ncbi:hypothetical protein SCMU_29430 [Sinomonas cyclohexanicum]|uniref:Uncharacterized protein n=1 Tax=Sinomonas cyclohexanicum TaxID=322009 RepID=A0ABM7PXS9_SINCY|nr:hypothetical protein SCMU_29430 [Corynebacterium cyclohexanicum]